MRYRGPSINRPVTEKDGVVRAVFCPVGRPTCFDSRDPSARCYRFGRLRSSGEEVVCIRDNPDLDGPQASDLFDVLDVLPGRVADLAAAEAARRRRLGESE